MVVTKVVVSNSPEVQCLCFETPRSSAPPPSCLTPLPSCPPSPPPFQVSSSLIALPPPPVLTGCVQVEVRGGALKQLSQLCLATALRELKHTCRVGGKAGWGEASPEGGGG